MNERKQQLTDEMERLQIQEGAGVSLARRGEIEQRRREINDELAAIEQAEQQQEREVHTQEVNETNSDIAISVFDALIPDTKVFESMMGLMEFSDWRSGFYQLFDGALADRTKLMDDKHAYELAQKDEKIRLLQSQGQEIQAQLDVANKQINVMQGIQMTSDAAYDQLSSSCHELEEENIELTKRIETAQVDAQEMQAQIARISAENFDNKNRVAELETKLEAAQNPKEESKPSQSFTDRMNEIKTKNSMSADEMILRFNARQKSDEAKIQVPDLPSAVLPFQGEDGENPAADVGNTQLPSAQVDETVGPQFPSAPNVATVHAPELGNQAQPTGVGMAEHSNDGETLEKTEAERIAELERRVEALESRVA